MEININVNHSPRDFYTNGLSFMKAAWRCYGKEEAGEYKIIDDGEFCQLTAPAVVNAAFSCEMFLKALLLLDGVDYGKSHDLLKLFNMLSDERKKLISRFCGDKDDVEYFKNILSKYSNTFVDVRYYIENQGWTGMNPTYMITLAYNMSKITNYIINNKES